MYEDLLDEIYAGSDRALARAISIVINEADGFEDLLNETPVVEIPVVGLTGPPGAGKSTLADRLINEFVRDGDRVAVICIDPSSPFSKGAILGDRIRMSEWYNHPSVFIRSLATRGSMGGLPQQAANVISLLKLAPFDYIIIETVGVGQNEVAISGIADCTIVVLVPEAGDDIQFMKAGLMEIADIFVVNKSDRPGADEFANDIRRMVRSDPHDAGKEVIKTSAITRLGIGELVSTIKKNLDKDQDD